MLLYGEAMTSDHALWIFIPGFSNYRVNAQGEILSVKREGTPERLLKPTVDDKGYPRVTLYGDDGRKRNFKVHNIVALVFHGPRPEGLVARHLNGNQLDNRPENLKYGTYAESNADQVRHGAHAEATKTHCDRGHEFSGDNLRFGYGAKSHVRKCKECHRINIASYRARLRERKAAQGAN